LRGRVRVWVIREHLNFTEIFTLPLTPSPQGRGN
jgi:hypothetical protein